MANGPSSDATQDDLDRQAQQVAWNTYQVAYVASHPNTAPAEAPPPLPVNEAGPPIVTGGAQTVLP